MPNMLRAWSRSPAFTLTAKMSVTINKIYKFIFIMMVWVNDDDANDDEEENTCGDHYDNDDEEENTCGDQEYNDDD